MPLPGARGPDGPERHLVRPDVLSAALARPRHGYLRRRRLPLWMGSEGIYGKVDSFLGGILPGGTAPNVIEGGLTAADVASGPIPLKAMAGAAANPKFFSGVADMLKQWVRDLSPDRMKQIGRGQAHDTTKELLRRELVFYGLKDDELDLLSQSVLNSVESGRVPDITDAGLDVWLASHRGMNQAPRGRGSIGDTVGDEELDRIVEALRRMESPQAAASGGRADDLAAARPERPVRGSRPSEAVSEGSGGMTAEKFRELERQFAEKVSGRSADSQVQEQLARATQSPELSGIGIAQDAAMQGDAGFMRVNPRAGEKSIARDELGRPLVTLGRSSYEVPYRRFDPRHRKAKPVMHSSDPELPVDESFLSAPGRSGEFIDMADLGLPAATVRGRPFSLPAGTYPDPRYPARDRFSPDAFVREHGDLRNWRPRPLPKGSANEAASMPYEVTQRRIGSDGNPITTVDEPHGFLDLDRELADEGFFRQRSIDEFRDYPYSRMQGQDVPELTPDMLSMAFQHPNYRKKVLENRTFTSGGLDRRTGLGRKLERAGVPENVPGVERDVGSLLDPATSAAEREAIERRITAGDLESELPIFGEDDLFEPGEVLLDERLTPGFLEEFDEPGRATLEDLTALEGFEEGASGLGGGMRGFEIVDPNESEVMRSLRELMDRPLEEPGFDPTALDEIAKRMLLEEEMERIRAKALRETGRSIDLDLLRRGLLPGPGS